MTDNLTCFPEYNTSLEENAEYLRRILPLMSRHNIAIVPLNFAIFYEYTVGKNASLNREIDSLLATKFLFTTELSIRLFKKHIADTSFNSLDKINRTLMQFINSTSETLNNTGEKANAATVQFQSHSKKLESNQSLPDIKSVLIDIIAETQELAETSKQLKTQLDESALKLEMLHQELAQVHEIAKTDALTGLLNRRAFDQKLDENIKQNNSELCLLLLDLDHFKKVNDTYGHQVGDNVIRYTANLMKQQITKNHYAARYGGEEMAIIMPDTSLNQALEIAEKIRSSLAQHPLKRKGSQESIGTVTVSIGVSDLKSNELAESLIERADKAMYWAKNNGRNQVIADSRI